MNDKPLHFSFSQYAMEQAGARILEVEEKITNQLKQIGPDNTFFMAVHLDKSDDGTIYCCIGDQMEHFWDIQVVKGQAKIVDFEYDPKVHPPEFEGKKLMIPEPVDRPDNFVFREVGHA